MEFSSHLLEFDDLVKDLRRKGLIQEQVADRCFVLRGEPGAFQDATHDVGLTILGLIHGNEYGGLGCINRLLLSVLQGTIKPLFPLGIALGNIPAGFEEVRFTEKDLNRVFKSAERNSFEERRAAELEPLIRRSRFLLDIHQTIEPTVSPFFIMGFNEEALQFANELAPETPIVTYPTHQRVQNGVTTTGLAMLTGGIAVAIELGQKGFAADQISFGFNVIEQAIGLLNDSQEELQGAARRILEGSLPDDQTVYYFAHSIANLGEESDLHAGFVNFSAIKAGASMGRWKNEELLSPMDGFVLFPKYQRSKLGSKELCVILQSSTVKSYKEQISKSGSP